VRGARSEAENHRVDLGERFGLGEVGRDASRAESVDRARAGGAARPGDEGRLEGQNGLEVGVDVPPDLRQGERLPRVVAIAGAPDQEGARADGVNRLGGGGGEGHNARPSPRAGSAARGSGEQDEDGQPPRHRPTLALACHGGATGMRILCAPRAQCLRERS
jgi:hypothetical protein